MSHTCSPAMLIVFSALQQSQRQAVSLDPTTLEEGLDWLNALVAKGWQLSSIYLIDEHSNIRLPLEAFDGQPVSEVLRELEQQWQAVLRPTRRFSVHIPLRAAWIESRIELIKKQLQLTERKIELIKGSIHRLQALLNRAEAHPGGVSHHYELVLAQLQATLGRYRQQRLLQLTRLGQLRTLLKKIVG